MQKILVTGGASFIGLNIAPHIDGKYFYR